MRLVVENIASTGRTVAFGLADAWAATATAEALEGEITDARGTLEISAPVNGRVAVAAHVEATAERICDRCAEPVRLNISADVPLLYDPMTAVVARDDDEPLDEADLDIGWYEGGELDLVQVVSEAVALQLPPRILCADTDACEARTAEILAAQAAKLPPPVGGFAALSLPGGLPPRSHK